MQLHNTSCGSFWINYAIDLLSSLQPWCSKYIQPHMEAHTKVRISNLVMFNLTEYREKWNCIVTFKEYAQVKCRHVKHTFFKLNHVVILLFSLYVFGAVKYTNSVCITVCENSTWYLLLYHQDNNVITVTAFQKDSKDDCRFPGCKWVGDKREVIYTQ
jgi:hypothetical protein